MDAEDPSTIYVAKNKSPLLIGLGDGYNMVCSDAMAMIRETNQYMEIHDQELVIVKADSVEVQDYDGNVKERDSYTAVSPDWLIKMKSGFLLRSGIPYPNSDEIPSSTGVSVNSSNIFLEANPAW